MNDHGRTWDGDEYQKKFDALAEQGVEVHGEVDFLLRLDPAPGRVLDAGCGTGRVAVELRRRGIDVTGVDVDESMLATARDRVPEISWVHADLTALDLGEVFRVVVMAGNVPLFTPPGTEGALVAGVARHVEPMGRLVSGFSLGRGYETADYDAHCAAAGLTLVDRYSTWDGEPFTEASDYTVNVHQHL